MLKRGKSTTQRFRVTVDADPAVLQMLSRYLVVINAYLKSKEWPAVTQARLFGAILTRFILEHEAHIHEQYARVEAEQVYEDIGRFEPDALTQLEEAPPGSVLRPTP